MKYFAAVLLLATAVSFAGAKPAACGCSAPDPQSPTSSASAQVLADDWAIQKHGDLLKYRTQCIAKYDIADEQLAKYKAWQFEDAELTHNYIYCVFGKLGLFDDATGFRKERIFQQLTHSGGADEAEVRSLIDQCAAEAQAFDGTVAYKAYKGLKCFSKYAQLVKDSIKKD